MIPITRRDYNAKFEARATEDGKKYIEGYFARFDDKYEINKDAYETIDRQAFGKLDSHNVVCLWNHNSDLPLGTTDNRTAHFRVDEKGVWGSVEINEDDPMAVGAYARVKRGDVPNSSLGFNITNEQIIRHDNGTTEFRLMELDVHEFSPCTFAAYKGTAIAARSEQLAQMEQCRIDAQKEQLKARLNNIGSENTTA